MLDEAFDFLHLASPRFAWWVILSFIIILGPIGFFGWGLASVKYTGMASLMLGLGLFLTRPKK